MIDPTLIPALDAIESVLEGRKLRRYAPDPVVERDDAQELDEEIDAIERMDAEQFFEDQQAPAGDRR